VGWDRGTIWALTPLRGMESMHVIGVRVHVMPNISGDASHTLPDASHV
jgi:hypothetical protein